MENKFFEFEYLALLEVKTRFPNAVTRVSSDFANLLSEIYNEGFRIGGIYKTFDAQLRPKFQIKYSN